MEKLNSDNNLNLIVPKYSKMNPCDCKACKYWRIHDRMNFIKFDDMVRDIKWKQRHLLNAEDIPDDFSTFFVDVSDAPQRPPITAFVIENRRGNIRL